MKTFKLVSVTRTFVLCLAVACFAWLTGNADAAEKKSFKLAWSHYTGWEPLQLAKEKGLFKKWGDKFGINIELSEPMDYLESINQYTSGAYDGCAMTNMDALINPVQGGIDSTVLVIGDYSNGNDGVVAKKAKTMAEMKGRKVNLPVGSVSHYLLSRGLSMNNMKGSDVKVENTSSESDLLAIFESGSNAAIVTWNPPLMTIRTKKDANLLFDSSKIPGEILDMIVVRTDAPDSFKKAVTGAWFEALALMNGKDAQAKEAIAFMAKYSGTNVDSFLNQLGTTAMFYTPAEAYKFATGDDVVKTMEYVRNFCVEQKLLGNPEKAAETGIWFPGKVLGNPDKIRLRFDAAYMEMAAENKL